MSTLSRAPVDPATTIQRISIRLLIRRCQDERACGIRQALSHTQHEANALFPSLSVQQPIRVERAKSIKLGCRNRQGAPKTLKNIFNTCQRLSAEFSGHSSGQGATKKDDWVSAKTIVCPCMRATAVRADASKKGLEPWMMLATLLRCSAACRSRLSNPVQAAT